MQHNTQVEILRELMAQLDEGRNIDAGSQIRMPTSAYVDPQIAAREWDTLFRNHPQLIGLASDLPDPGSFLTLDDFGLPLLATRDKDGRFHAFLNACRHRSVKVATAERGRRSVFTCPFHSWSYGNNGALLTVPDEAHFGAVERACHGLIELPAVERDGLLWVHPDAAGTLEVESLLGTPLAQELASYQLAGHRYIGEKTIDMKLNWKFANDTFGETYHFQKLHKDTLGRLYYGNNLHLTEFGRHHRFVTANYGIDELRTRPESEWRIEQGTFVLYYLFPNIQLLIDPATATLIRIYPHPQDPGRSITRISFYYTQAAIDAVEAAKAAGQDTADAYDRDAYQNTPGGLETQMEVFYSTVQQEDYVMGEMQQRAAETGVLKEVVFGRNEPALHHFHRSFREALELPPLGP